MAPDPLHLSANVIDPIRRDHDRSQQVVLGPAVIGLVDESGLDHRARSFSARRSGTYPSRADSPLLKA